MGDGRLRLRLVFDDDVPSDVLGTLGRRIMYQPLYIVPHIASLGLLIQHDFGINSSGPLALSIDSWRLPLCSSTAVLRDDDVLKVSLASETEPELQVARSVPWKAGLGKTLALTGVQKKPASKLEAALALANGTAPSSEQQKPRKKRKNAQPDEPEARDTSQAMLPANAKAVPSETGTGEGTRADSDATEGQESDEPKTKGPSRNARRKKHKRQLKRLGLLGSLPCTPGGQNRDQAGMPQGARAQTEEDASQTKQMRLQGHAARPDIEEPPQARETHTNLPKRGEKWQHSSDVAEFLQKGHVYFPDSASEGDMLLTKEGTPEHAVEAQSEQRQLNVPQGNGVILGTKRQADQSRSMQHVQQMQQSHQTASMDPESLPRPSPYPLEGDVVAYRLLHIGPDWTPQVSEWREGRVMSLDTSDQSIVVEPWQRGSTLQSGAAEGLRGDTDEDEHPPTEYDEDGVLRTSLHSFSDLRVIQAMASRTPASGRIQAARERARRGAEREQQTMDRATPSSHPPEPPEKTGALREAPSLGAAAWEADAVHDQPRPVRATAASLATAAAASAAGPRKQPAAVHTATEAAAAHAGQKPAPMQQPAAPPTIGGLFAAGQTARYSPAAFAEAAAALKRRRAELAQQRTAQLANTSPMQPRHAIARQQTSEVIHTPSGSWGMHPQSQQITEIPGMQCSAPAIEATAPVQKPVHPRGAPKPDEELQIAGDQNATLSAEPAAAMLEGERPQADAAIPGADDAQAPSQVRLGDIHSAADTQKQVQGVRTRSAARRSGQSGPNSPAASEPARHEMDSNGGHKGPVTGPADHASGSEGQIHAGGPEGQAHQKRTRASTRGSLIGPLLARLRREEQEGGHDALQSP